MTQQVEVLGKSMLDTNCWQMWLKSSGLTLELRPNDLFWFYQLLTEWMFGIYKATASYDRGHGENKKTVAPCQGNGKDWMLMQSFVTWWKTTDVGRHTLLKPHTGYFHSLRTWRILTRLLQAKLKKKGSMILFNIDHTTFALMHKGNK